MHFCVWTGQMSQMYHAVREKPELCAARCASTDGLVSAETPYDGAVFCLTWRLRAMVLIDTQRASPEEYSATGCGVVCLVKYVVPCEMAKPIMETW